MPRCGDCNKFVSLEQADPDVTNTELTVNEDEITFDVDVSIANNCAECGTELRTAELNLSETFDEEPEDGSEYEIDIEDVSATCDSVGKGRGAKTFYGFEAVAVLSRGGEEVERKVISENIQASHMDEV
jgi:hypothetical protein